MDRKLTKSEAVLAVGAAAVGATCIAVYLSRSQWGSSRAPEAPAAAEKESEATKKRKKRLHSLVLPDSKQPREALMYASRQMVLFTTGEGGKLVRNTNLMINEILAHSLRKIPAMEQKYPNYCVRTRFGVLDKSEQRYNRTISQEQVVMVDIVRNAGISEKARALVRAGPREKIAFKCGYSGSRNVTEVRAAIVTCGGLCPGLNDVIEELVYTLYYNYGSDCIFGVPSGYRGISPGVEWMDLVPGIEDASGKKHTSATPVRGIHRQGGTILGSSRGGFNPRGDKDLHRIVDELTRRKVNQLYIIGGDGTHRGAKRIMEEVKKRGLKIGVIGIPKTIDNDIGLIDRSFGFNTAVAEAERAIESAIVEAKCIPNGIGIVKLMGRHAGYIAANATLASRQVHLCLIPEVEFRVSGPNNILEYVEDTIKRRGHAVVVVAEGAGAHLKDEEGETDESGNKRLGEIGLWLKRRLIGYFETRGKTCNVKYHDPSYMVRSVPANASDSIMCSTLAQNAVHGAMAGYTGFTSAIVNNRSVYIPFELVGECSPAYLNPHGRTWERLLAITQQPVYKDEDAALLAASPKPVNPEAPPVAKMGASK